MKIKLLLAMLACAAAVMAAPKFVMVNDDDPMPWENMRLNMDASYTWGNNTTQSFAGIDIRGVLRMTNSESAGALEVVDAVIDAEIDDAYYARFNGGWADIGLLALMAATNGLHIRVGTIESWPTGTWATSGATNIQGGAANSYNTSTRTLTYVTNPPSVPTTWSSYPAQQIVDFASKGASNLARIHAPEFGNLTWGHNVDAPIGGVDGYGIVVGHATKGGDLSVVIGGLSKDWTENCTVVGREASGRAVSSSIGMSSEATNRSSAFGFYAKAYNYGVALGEYSYADNHAVAIGHGITNLIPNSTRIKGALLMGGSNITDVGTVAVTNLQITGGSPSNGAIWVATNTSGQGGWNSFVAFNANLTNANFLYTNTTGRAIQFGAPFGNIRYNYGSAFDGTQFTAPVSGWYAFSFVCRWTRAFGTAGASDFHIRKNGNIIGSRTIEGGQEGLASFGAIGTEYYLATGDYIDVYVVGRAGTTNSVGDITGRFTVFSGHLVRALPE